MKPKTSIRIGISSCLLGESVRFNAGHKRDEYITDVLSRHFEFVPVCPEVEAGFGVPREPMHFVKVGKENRLLTEKTGRDLTDKLRDFSTARVKALNGLSGYLFKKKSPSCGMEMGLFAQAFRAANPDVPVEEEGRLRNPELRDNWLERVFSFHQLQKLWSDFTMSRLIQFHTAHKLALLSHSEAAYRRLGRLVATAKGKSIREEYQREFMEALKTPATRKKCTNVLEHMAGYFKKKLDRESKKELAEAIRSYYSGRVPILVPLTLIQHYVRIYDVDYLRGQTFLVPRYIG